MESRVNEPSLRPYQSGSGGGGKREGLGFLIQVSHRGRWNCDSSAVRSWKVFPAKGSHQMHMFCPHHLLNSRVVDKKG